MSMLIYLLPILAGALAGGLAGGLLLWWHHRHQPSVSPSSPAEFIDPWVAAQIDQAAATWATQHGRPEAAPLMADKLRLLHRLGIERGWSE